MTEITGAESPNSTQLRITIGSIISITCPCIHAVTHSPSVHNGLTIHQNFAL